MKNYVIVARFDDEMTGKLTALRKKLHDENHMIAISEWQPYITIAAYENIDIQVLLQWTDEFAKTHSIFDISFSSLGSFPPYGEHTETAVLFASPSQSKSLIDFYYAFHEKLDDYCGKLGWLYSAKWGFPAIHSTIGIFEVPQIQKAMKMIFASQIFGKTKMIALEVYTYPMELIQRFELNN
ncbi:2'-5' RNA ligase family protein [Amphibacillus sp. Q70]|uniref:2'-5' RNA ligase family protein n=1 Tax=Amphibacillus sp. Q70 TaxID=3453416 RepID=UPI003F8536DF